jgi:integrase/recombinase XerD
MRKKLSKQNDQEELVKVLDTFSLDRITAAIFYDTRRVKANLMFPVKYRVTFMRNRFYYPSGIDLTEDEWKRMPAAKGKELKRKRELVKSGFDKIRDHIIDMVKGEGFTLEALNTRLSRGRQNSAISEFYSKIDRLEEEGRVNTASSYRCAVRSIQKYTSKNLKFSDITPDWLRKYEAHLINEGRSLTTIGIYMRSLRAIMNDGRTFITPAQYPFGKGKYEIRKGSGRKMALTLPQINKILKYPLQTEESRKYRDLWYFSFLCNGININDLLRLKFSNIVNGEIFFYRGKTITTNSQPKEIKATLLPEMEQIIKKWGNRKRNPENYIFPYLYDGMAPSDIRKAVQNITWLINNCMKKIGTNLNYGNITTYSSRHSFATILKHNQVSIAFISESLGHTDLKTTENYLASFDQEERAKNAALLTKFEKQEK